MAEYGKRHVIDLHVSVLSKNYNLVNIDLFLRLCSTNGHQLILFQLLQQNSRMVWLCVMYHLPLKAPVDWENSKISHFLSLGKGSENSQQPGKKIECRS